MTKKLGGVVVICVLSACASNGSNNQPEIAEHFVTDITADGSKLFSYSLAAEGPNKKSAAKSGRPPSGGKGDGAKRGQRGGRQGNRPDGQKRHDKLEETAYALLEKKLESTAYCRESYIELSKDKSPGRMNIKGECNDAATDADLLEFSGRPRPSLGLEKAE